VAACRYALPDRGLLSFGEMFAAVQDIMRGASLPVIVDAENGYGEGAMVARCVLSYQRLGVGAICIEDTAIGPNKQKVQIPVSDAIRRIKIAVSARSNGSTAIVARTGVRNGSSPTEFAERARALVRAGADIIFIDQAGSSDDLAVIAKQLKRVRPLMTLSGVAGTHALTPIDLRSMGFSIILTPLAIMMSSIEAMSLALDHLRNGELSRTVYTSSDLASLLQAPSWTKYDA